MKKNFTLIALIMVLINGHTIAQNWTNNGIGLSASGVCIIDLSVPEDDVAWGILSVFSSGTCGGIVPYYTKTTNGNTWNSGFISMLPNITPVCISAISGSTAWILASDISTNTTGYVYQTTNGGSTWNLQNNSYSTDAGRFIHFFDMNDGVKVGDSSISITNDGGAHWISNGALPVDTAFIGSGITNFILNSYEVVGNTIWLGDVYGYFYKSNDRGVTWIRMLNNIFPNSIKGIAFKDSLNGMVAASHYVGGGSGSSGGTNVDESFFTNDGGVTWNPMPIHFNSPNVDDQSAKYDVAYVPGTNNTFIVTSEYDATVAAFSGITYDGGLNWSLIDSTQQHTVCVFTSPTNGYSGGYIPSFFEGIYKWNGNLSVGINEKQNQEFISVFPNPAYDKLTIILNKTFVDELQEIQIINTLGKIVLEYKINELKDAEINLELSSLPEGLFIINAQTNDFNNHTYKFTHIH